MIGVKQGCMYW